MPLNLNPTQAAILGLLLEGSRTGHDIFQTAGKWMSPYWSMTRSQIYRELPVLAEMGLVHQGEMESRSAVPYRVSALGKKELKAWLAEEPGDDLLRNQVALRIVMGRHQSIEQLAVMTQNAIESSKEKLAEAELLFEEAEELPWDQAALAFAIAYHKAVIAWLKTIKVESIAG